MAKNNKKQGTQHLLPQSNSNRMGHITEKNNGKPVQMQWG
jgi:hypothetical protein